MADDLTLSGLDASSQALLDYWRKIRGDELVPSRSSFRPGDITCLLPSLMLLEYRDPFKLIYRLVGTEIGVRMGLDFTGMDALELALPHQMAASGHRFNALRTQPCGLVIYKQLLSKYGTAFVSEQIYLPLRDRAGAITQLVAMCNVIERYESGKAPGALQSMAVIDANFLDIGAGVPAQLSDSLRAAS